MCANAVFSFQISVSKLPWRFFRKFDNTKEHWLCASLYEKLAQNVCPWEWSHNTYMEKCEAFRKHKSATLWRAGELKLLKDTRMEKKSGSIESNMRSRNLAPYPSWKDSVLSNRLPLPMYEEGTLGIVKDLGRARFRRKCSTTMV